MIQPQTPFLVGVRDICDNSFWPLAVIGIVSTTSVLTAAKFVYAIGAGITAAAGTRLALQWLLDRVFRLCSFRMQSNNALIRYFLSLPPPCGDWVICAPAAFLGSGSRFSCSLSGTEPWFPVTRCRLGRPLPYQLP